MACLVVKGMSISRIYFWVIAAFEYLWVNQQQQKRTITGTVRIGDTNEPAIGATVYLQNSTIGAVTDVDGKYSIFQPMARPTMTATAWKD